MHPGGLVTREELRKKLWPNDTIVEFEHSIHAAINRLRLALGDTAKNPQFIETLARKGYRWKTSVEWRGPEARPEPEKLVAATELIGKKVSHYRVLGVLGGGGMGVVYRAEDLKLGRAVALKFLPEELAKDTVAMERFSREARAASALNHPNICTIYGIEEHEGQPFLAMELLEGKTLRDVIAGGGTGQADRQREEVLPLNTVIDIGIQICDGLSAAHDKGIIHRDVKPANIFLTANGTAKLLDFGLAKRWEQGKPETENERGEQKREQSQDLTVTGTTVGTAGYMSPEQVRGESLDARSDLFSFGLVLYELVTGRQAFSGNTAAELRSQVLEHEPAPVGSLNPKTPRKLEELIHRAIAKTREERFQSAGELRSALAQLKTEADLGKSRGRGTLWLAGAAALIVAAILIWPGRAGHSKARAVGMWRQKQLTVNSNENPVTGGAISPDGRILAFTDFEGIHIKQVEGGDARGIANPEVYKESPPSWQIGYWMADSTHFFAIAELPQRKAALWLISTAGEAARKIADGANPWGVSPDGSMVALTENDDHDLWVADCRSGKQTLLLRGGESSRFRAIHWAPDGQRLVYIRNVAVAGRNESHIEVLNRKSGATHELAGGPVIQTVSELEEGFQDLIWLSSERVIFVGGVPDIQGLSCNLWELKLDRNTAEVVSGPEQITNWAGFCVTNLSKTADGKKLAFTRSSDLTTVSVADYDPVHNTIGLPRRITLTEDLSSTLGWSSDGRSLFIRSNREGQWEIFKQKLGDSKAEAVYTEEAGVFNVTLTPDNQWVLYQKRDPADPSDVMRLKRVALAGDREEEVWRGKNFVLVCSRASKGKCVIGEVAPDKDQLIFAELDPMKGKGNEIGKVLRTRADETAWVLSPDGSQVALFEEFGQEVDVLSFRDQRMRRISLRGAHLRTLTWSPTGEGFYASSAILQGAELLYIDLAGQRKKLWELDGSNTFLQAEASPDGKHMAIGGSSKSSNLWILEDF